MKLILLNTTVRIFLTRARGNIPRQSINNLDSSYLTRFWFTTLPIPFSRMQIILLFYPIDHQILVIPPDIT